MTRPSRAGLAAAGAVVALGAAIFGWSHGPAPEAQPPETAAATLDGAALFTSKGCATCHRGPDSTALMGDFPDLSSAPTWAGTRRDGLDAAAYLAESIREPWAFTAPGFSGSVGPTTGMPGLGLTEPEIDALVGYLLES